MTATSDGTALDAVQTITVTIDGSALSRTSRAIAPSASASDASPSQRHSTMRAPSTRARAARYGLSPGDINSTIRVAIGGDSAGDLNR